MQTTIRFRGGPADGLERQVDGAARVGDVVHAPALDADAMASDPDSEGAVYVIAAAQAAPLFAVAAPTSLDARADYIGPR